MQSTFTEMANELRMHMMKEENILFPYLAAMEKAVSEKRVVPPAMFGSVANPVTTMMKSMTTRARLCVCCVKPATATRRPKTLAGATANSTGHWPPSRRTCTRTCIWRTTSCFRAHSTWRLGARARGLHRTSFQAIKEAVAALLSDADKLWRFHWRQPRVTHKPLPRLHTWKSSNWHVRVRPRCHGC